MLGWFRALMPREERFFELFTRHARVTLTGAEALRALLSGGDVPQCCLEITRRENEADEITREVLTVIPQHQREAVLALGATRWEMIRMGVLRNARAGIVGAIILGLGRALGETMAVTMVIGNRPEIAKSLFAPGYTMASVLANEFTEATGDLYLSALIEIGLALFFVTIVVNALARLMVWSVTRGQPARSVV